MEQQKPARSVMRPLGDDWYVVFEWPEGVEDGGPSKLTIQSVDGTYPVGGLSSTVLRHINFKDAIAELREQVTESERRGRVFDLRAQIRADRLRSSLTDRVTDDYLALLSAEYVRAVARGQAKVNDYLAEKVDVPVNTIRGHLAQARKRALLSGSPGRKGGELSSEAIKILNRINEEDVEILLNTLDQIRGSGA